MFNIEQQIIKVNKAYRVANGLTMPPIIDRNDYGCSFMTERPQDGICQVCLKPHGQCECPL